MLGYSGEGLFAPAGEAVPFFAYFAAPQDPIDQVDVSLPEIGVTFESVEALIGDLQAGDGVDAGMSRHITYVSAPSVVALVSAGALLMARAGCPARARRGHRRLRGVHHLLR